MVELLVIGVLGGIVLAAVLWIVIYRAMGNLIDWLILTFGNAESAEQVKRRRQGGSGDA